MASNPAANVRRPIVPEQPVPVLTDDELRALLASRAAKGFEDRRDTAVATYPLQEGLWELLITALYRAGRQGDALATYQRVRVQLAAELGLDPGPRLQQLERGILAHDPTLGGPTATFGPGPPAGNLPSLSAELVGRDADVAALLDLLAGRRLIGIVGREASGRRRWPSPPASASPGRRVASGWPGWRRRRAPTWSTR